MFVVALSFSTIVILRRFDRDSFLYCYSLFDASPATATPPVRYLLALLLDYLLSSLTFFLKARTGLAICFLVSPAALPVSSRASPATATALTGSFRVDLSISRVEAFGSLITFGENSVCACGLFRLTFTILVGCYC